MRIQFQRARQLLQEFRFRELFIEELGWANPPTTSVQLEVEGARYSLIPVAEQGGMQVFEVSSPNEGSLPSRPTRLKIERQLTPLYYEHLLLFTNTARTVSVWQWVKREAGKAAAREHRYDHTQPGDLLLQKLAGIAFRFEDLDEEGKTTIGAVLDRVQAAFDVERVTRRFYDEFKKHHETLLQFIQGIQQLEHRQWYASVLLNRLMFIYFIQKKGFLDNDPDYLSHKLQACQAQGRNYYHDFLRRLFFDGFARQPNERSPETQALLGPVPFLDGGIFLPHPLEREYPAIAIADAAFEELFAFFNRYTWHLDDRPLRADNEINPDVLGYIFEKYINQKQMGAYYTKEDITGYISQNTLIPFLFDAAAKKCPAAFKSERASLPPVDGGDRGGDLHPDESPVWRLLQADPDRYLYDAVRRGVIDEDGNVIPETALPDFVQQGMRDPQARMFDRRYNLGEAFIPDAQGNNRALPTETWREYVVRRERCLELRQKLANGDVHQINDLITFNLNLRQFAQDVIEDAETPQLLRAFWHAIESVTVLDPTCGSGAFLFAALNVLEPFYEACLSRMAQFLADLETSGAKHRPEKFSDFRRVLERIHQHPNRCYFILKSIIVNNLFGVDIMEEAVEICKLRLFLKLVAQVERVENLEPLPDIDFNIRAGNTLVGYATYDEVQRAVTSRLDFDDAMERIEEKAQDVDRLFGHFRQQQTELGGEVTAEDKQALRGRLKELEDELNRYLAGEYGVTLPSPGSGRGAGGEGRAYEQWLRSHKPFHWFIEFYGIMKRGGFDVIIGNPPYVEYKTVRKQYSVRGFETHECGDLYAFVMEQSSNLLGKYGRMGMIVPVSIISTDGFSSLRDFVCRTNRISWSLSFAERPSKLFTGAEKRLTIWLSCKEAATSLLFLSNYRRWFADERDFLFSKISFVPKGAECKLAGTAIPKIATPIEAQILTRLSQQRRLDSFFVKNSSQIVYYTRKLRYFVQFFDFIPSITDSRGKRLEPSELKEIFLSSAARRDVTIAILNSNLFFWFFSAYSDVRNVNRREIEAFRCSMDSMDDKITGDLRQLCQPLMKDFNDNSTFITNDYGKYGVRTIQSFQPRLSKPLLDEIDRVLARHYGFTDEELDFIINYDLKYRMGQEGKEEEK